MSNVVPPRVVVQTSPRPRKSPWPRMGFGLVGVLVSGIFGYCDYQEKQQQAERERRRRLQNDPELRRMLDPGTPEGRSASGKGLQELLKKPAAEATR